MHAREELVDRQYIQVLAHKRKQQPVADIWPLAVVVARRVKNGINLCSCGRPSSLVDRNEGAKISLA